MEVIDESVALLSNFEVYDLLVKSTQKRKSKKPNGGSQNLATVTYETTEYLSKTPCAHQNPAIVQEFLKALIPYKLTKAEKLQLLNLRPTSPVEIQPIIEEIEERFTETEIESMLDIVATILPDSEPMEASPAQGGNQEQVPLHSASKPGTQRDRDGSTLLEAILESDVKQELNLQNQ